MLSHNRPRHIWLANAAASSNFVFALIMVGALPEEFFAFAEEVNKGPQRVLSPFFVGLFGEGKTSKNENCCAHCARGDPSAEARGLASCRGRVDRQPWFRLVDSTG
jgi:hypothetical protein